MKQKAPHVVNPADPSTWRGGLSEAGWEMPDPRPMSAAVKMAPPPTLHELLAHLVRGELSRRAAAEDVETFDDADDFDVGDDYDPRSPHELDEVDDEAPRGQPDPGAPPPPVPPAPAPGSRVASPADVPVPPPPPPAP